MSNHTKIEWTDATWNPLRGCSRVSEGCRNCYAERVAARFSGPDQAYEGLAEMTPHGPRWTGKVRLIEDALYQPLRWKRPRKVFVNSMSDLFHPRSFEHWIDRIFAVMYECQWHTFQVLTKRPERMKKYLNDPLVRERIARAALKRWRSAHVAKADYLCLPDVVADVNALWPLKNVWLGVSVEDHQSADARIPELLATPAAVRFLSCEPLLGPLNVRPYLMAGHDPAKCRTCGGRHGFMRCPNYGGISRTGEHQGAICTDFARENFAIHWVIAGGESGPKARPMRSAWVESLRDQCVATAVPFFFKQWGEFLPLDECGNAGVKLPVIDAMNHAASGAPVRCGKKRAGRLLAGRTWDEFPQGEL